MSMVLDEFVVQCILYHEHEHTASERLDIVPNIADQQAEHDKVSR